jgi:hypothetical protein
MPTYSPLKGDFQAVKLLTKKKNFISMNKLEVPYAPSFNSTNFSPAKLDKVITFFNA